MTELQTHIAIYGFLCRVLPPSHMVFHPANGELRDKRAAAKLKAMGVVAGVADLVILRPAGRVAVIEVKAEGGRLSTEQSAFRVYCRRNGIPHGICRSIEDAREFVAELGIETREAA